MQMNFSDFISKVPDFRRKQGQRYSFSSIMWLIFSATSCGYTSIRKIVDFGNANSTFFKEKFNWANIPSNYVIFSFFANLEMDNFCKSFSDWVSKEYSGSKTDIWLGGDGQMLKSTLVNANTSEQNFVALVSLFCEDIGLTLAISNYHNKAKDVGEASKLLDIIDNYFMGEGITFTMDALHCQKKR